MQNIHTVIYKNYIHNGFKKLPLLYFLWHGKLQMREKYHLNSKFCTEKHLPTEDAT